MQMPALLRLRASALVAVVAFTAFSGSAGADPPSRVARLSFMTGAVSFSPAGEDDWVQATINRPLTTGDRLWADAGARTEIQVGGAMIRMNADTGVTVLNLDDRITQLQLTQGALNVRVRRLEPDQVFEVNTPNLAFAVRQPGEYRIEVDPDGDATTIVVRKGQAEVYGEGAAYAIDSRQPYRFTGTGLRNYEYVEVPPLDDFDRWSRDRDRRYDNSRSARYVSEDVVGYQDLDEYGTWRVDVTYGNVWVPNRVAADWAPYHDGHWAWVDPWGWTWVDDAPWGFAVSHYGRWTNLRGSWGWVPGPVRTRAYYAPALVAFIGDDHFQLTISSGNIGGVAWFPLGPREVYRPAYPVSRHYFENVNHSNTVINNTVINNFYDNSNVTNIVYANRRVEGAVVAVPATAFVQSQPVSRSSVRVSRDMIARAPVADAPSLAPTGKSVRGAAAQRDKPPRRAFERPAIVRTAPPAARAGFAAQEQHLKAKPGRPLDDDARKQLKPAAAETAPVVKLIVPTNGAPKATRRPPPAPTAKPTEARGRSDERTGTLAPMQDGVPSQARPPMPAAKPPKERDKVEQHGREEQSGQPIARPPEPPHGAPQPEIAPTPPVLESRPPKPRDKSEQRDNGDLRGQPAAKPPRERADEEKTVPSQATPTPAPATKPPPQRAAEPKVTQPKQAAPPASTAQQPARSAKPEPKPATKQVEPGRPVAESEKPSTRSAPKAEPRGQKPKTAADKPSDKPSDKKKASDKQESDKEQQDEETRGTDNRKQNE